MAPSGQSLHAAVSEKVTPRTAATAPYALRMPSTLTAATSGYTYHGRRAATRRIESQDTEGEAAVSETRELITPVRLVDETEVPAVGRWSIDPTHSSLAFSARHAVTRMRGRFRSFQGTIEIAEVPEHSSVEVVIDAASIDTTNTAADDSMRSEYFLHVAQFPEIVFRSTSVRHGGDNRWVVDGDLAMRGLTRPITLDLTFEGAVPLAKGPLAKMGVVARGQFDRRQYGMTVNSPLPGGGWILGNGVQLELDVEAELFE